MRIRGIIASLVLAVIIGSKSDAAQPIISYVQITTGAVQRGGFSTQTGVVGQMNVTGLSTGECVQTGANGLLQTTGAQCGSGSGGGGASTLEVIAGAVRSSPTVTVGFPSPQFTGALSGSSVTVTLNSSSVTLQGNTNVALLNSTQTYTGQPTFTDDVRISRPKRLIFLNSVGTSASWIYNPYAPGINSLSIEAQGQGVGIGNHTGFGSQNPFFTDVDVLVNNRFAVSGSSANGTQTYSGFSAASPVQQSILWKLPSKDGAANTALLTDGSGNLTFGTIPATAGGSTTQIQYNNAGTLAGSADMTFHDGNAIINITDTSNPYSAGPGYGIKQIITGHLGLPTTLYGSYVSVGGQVAGDTYGYYADAIDVGLGTSYGAHVLGSGNANNYGLWTSAPGGGNNYAIWVDSGQVQFNSSMTVVGKSLMTSSTTASSLLVTHRGTPASLQSPTGGAVNITVVDSLTPNLVIVSSYPNLQNGTAMFETYQQAPDFNDPLWRIFNVGHESNPFLRVDDGAPDMEIVTTSTDGAHGLGKWEPFAVAYQGINLQINNRAYDNSTFENLAYWHPLHIGTPNDTEAPGLYLQAQNSNEDLAVVPSSGTSSICFSTLNNRQRCLTAPPNSPNTWTEALPDNLPITGSVMYHGGTVASGNRTVRQMRWTATDWIYSPTTGVSASSMTATATFKPPVYTKAQLSARTPPAAYGSEFVTCSDCSNALVCISTGATAGGYASTQATNRTTACN